MSTDGEMNKDKVVHICKGLLISHKKEQNNAVWSDTDGFRDCHTV